MSLHSCDSSSGGVDIINPASPETAKKKSILKKGDSSSAHREETEKLIPGGSSFIGRGENSTTGDHDDEGNSAQIDGGGDNYNNRFDTIAPPMKPLVGGISPIVVPGPSPCTPSLIVGPPGTPKLPLKSIGPKKGPKPQAQPIKFVGIECPARPATPGPLRKSPVQLQGGLPPLQSQAKQGGPPPVPSQPMQGGTPLQGQHDGTVLDKNLGNAFGSLAHSIGITAVMGHIFDPTETKGVTHQSSNIEEKPEVTTKCSNPACNYQRVSRDSSSGFVGMCLCGSPIEGPPLKGPKEGHNRPIKIESLRDFGGLEILRRDLSSEEGKDSSPSPTEETKLLGGPEVTTGSDQGARKVVILRQTSKETSVMA